jgi:RNA polymerase sigma factor (sigma-70 family)
MQDLIAAAHSESDELGELYAALSGQLRQIVRFGVRAPDALIEDACQVAWSRLIRHQSSVRREAVLSWLVTTASREALKLIRRSDRELSLDELAERNREPPHACGMPAPDEIVELRSRLDLIRELPQRQQRLVWLQGLGLSYAEMAGYTGASPRTVERQLLRAKRALRSGDG